MRTSLAPFALSLFSFGAATAEAVVMTLRKQNYDWKAYLAALGNAVGRRVLQGLSLGLSASLLAYTWEHRLRDIPVHGALSAALLFAGEELCYYGFHRASHRVRWFWATHAVHHAPNDLNLAVAYQLGWTGEISGTVVFFLPLVWLGFAPSAVLTVLSINLLYQFWLHTRWIPKLGPLELLFNTPSHHRVHHACNPEYLGANYGGILIVFDRLFRTFVAERDTVPCRYGLVTPLFSYNPIYIAVHEWISMGRDLLAARGWRERFQCVFGVPGAVATFSQRPGTRDIRRNHA